MKYSRKDHNNVVRLESRRAALGKTTESAPARNKKRSHRDRYELRNVSATVLSKWSRVASCGNVPVSKFQSGSHQSPGVSKSDTGRASFHGVNACGHAYTCPVCAIKIAEQKRNHVLEALRKHREAGGFNLLVTLTFSHRRDESLMENIKNFMKALSRLKGRRSYIKAVKSLGYSGQIRSLETTHGTANGWHPHCHEIWFLDRQPTKEEIYEAQSTIFQEWRKVCIQFGLGEPNEKHGIDIKFNDYNTDYVGHYVTKWGHELTYHHTKKAGKGSLSPWQILENVRFYSQNWNYTKHSFYANLWKEYADAMHGRAQLFWSRGLKARFEIEEVSDEDLAQRPERHHVHTFTPEEWKLIKQYKKYHHVLTAAETSTKRLMYYLNALVSRENTRLSDLSQMKRAIRIHTLKRMRDWELGIN